MKLFLVILFTLFLSLPCFASLSYVISNKASISQSDISNWIKQAKEGDRMAQFELGYAYQNGNIVEQNIKKAKAWYKKAAEPLSASKNITDSSKAAQKAAQNNLALLIFNLNPKQKNKGLELLKKASKNGSFQSKMNLAEIYARGEFIKRNLKKAFNLELEVAKESGYPYAEYQVGLMYAKGIGTKPNFRQAYKFFSLAAKKDYPDAQFQLGLFYQYGHGISINLTKAYNMYLAAAMTGHAEAQLYLAAMYFYGNGIAKNYTKALKWFKKSATAGRADAQLNVGMFYENGYGVKINYSEAVKWYKKSAQNGDQDGQLYLALMYIEQKGVVQNIPEATKWLNKAAAQGNQQAVRILKKLEQQLK